MQARDGVELIAVERDPVIVVIDLETDPHARNVVHRLRNDRVVAQAPAHIAFDQAIERFVRLQLVFVARFARIAAHTFVALKVLQKSAAKVGIGIEEGYACELDYRDELQRDALRARFSLDHAKALEPRGQTDRNEQRDQREGSPEQPAEDKR